jgi:hypothetical protein
VHGRAVAKLGLGGLTRKDGRLSHPSKPASMIVSIFSSSPAGPYTLRRMTAWRSSVTTSVIMLRVIVGCSLYVRREQLLWCDRAWRETLLVDIMADGFQGRTIGFQTVAPEILAEDLPRFLYVADRPGQRES